MKILIALLLGLLVFFIIRIFIPKSKNSDITQMVKCYTCGTYIAKNEAITYNRHYFCSKACLN